MPLQYTPVTKKNTFHMTKTTRPTKEFKAIYKFILSKTLKTPPTKVAQRPVTAQKISTLHKSSRNAYTIHNHLPFTTVNFSYQIP